MSSENPSITEAMQDYLKIIYEETAGIPGERATTSAIADRMGIRPASVTGMLQRLAGEGLIDYRKHHGARLTGAGLEAALRVIRHHRLIETFLHKKLGFSWDEVHDEADRLEHFISTAVTQRMADLLGNPRRDPHGDPIPTRHLEVPDRVRKRLVDLSPGDKGTIARLSDHNPVLLQQAAALGVTPSVMLHVIICNDQEVGVEIGPERRQVAIPQDLAAHIFIEN